MLEKLVFTYMENIDLRSLNRELLQKISSG